MRAAMRVDLARTMAGCAAAACIAGVACGYAPVYAARAEPLHVKVVRSQIADAVAVDEVASGVREELARAGALAPGEAYPRVEIEVLRADEASEGVVAASSATPTVGGATPSGGSGGSSAAPVPAARGLDVAMVARAWIATGEGAAPQAETGDLRAEESIAVDLTEPGAGGGAASSPAADPRAGAFHHADALRAAARRLGRALGARVLGLPAASE